MLVRRSVLLLSALLVGSELSAQLRSSPLPAARIGLTAGLNQAKLAGPGLTDISNRNGFVGGLSLVTPFAQSFAFQLEALYSMKGAVSTSNTSSNTATFKLNYLEIPVMLRAEGPASSKIRPFGYAGAAADFQVQCGGEARSAGQTQSASCDELERGFSSGASFSKFDWGTVLGGGLAFDVAQRTLSLSARYEIGMRPILENGNSKNRVLSFMVSVESPLPRTTKR